MRELLAAGAHFGHQTRRWNPKMSRFIFGKSNGIHIVDLHKTQEAFIEAAEYVKELGSHGGSLLFVGTKRQAQKVVGEEAQACGQFYVTHRWLGGTLTNFVTIRKSIDRLGDIEERLADPEAYLTKKERVREERQRESMQRDLGGIREMDSLPDAIFIVDPHNEQIAVAEANRLGVTVIAMVDTNCDPDEIDYPIPSNDDSIRTIRLIVRKLREAYQEGAMEAGLITEQDLLDEAAAEAAVNGADPAAEAAAESEATSDDAVDAAAEETSSGEPAAEEEASAPSEDAAESEPEESGQAN